MALEMTWKEAINQVLGQYPGGLHYNEIAEKIIEQGLRKSVGGIALCPGEQGCLCLDKWPVSY